MTKDTCIKLMDGSYCQRSEIPDYSNQEVFIPVLQKSAKFIKRLEEEFCTLTTRLIGIYDNYLVYVDDIFINDDTKDFTDKYLTLYNIRDLSSNSCSGNSIFWKRGNKPVIVDFDIKKINSLSGEQSISLNFTIPINNIYPFEHWNFNGILDCVANAEDLAIQVRDAWERPESHTLIIHSISDDSDKKVGSFFITHDDDTLLRGSLLCIKNSKLYIERPCNKASIFCIYDLYGNLIEEVKDFTMKDEWIKEQNDISYKTVIHLGNSLFVEYKHVKRNFIPITYNFEGFPDIRFLQSRLRSDGLLNDNKPYYVQWYWETCSNETNLSQQLSAISSSNALETIENSTYFESNKLQAIAKSINILQNLLQSEQDLIVWIPDTISYKATETMYVLQKELLKCCIKCSMGSNFIIPGTDSKKVIFIVDFQTDKQRQNYLVNKVIRLCPGNEPLIMMISLNKIIDEQDLMYLNAVYKLRLERNLFRRRSVVKSYFDEGATIMDSLAGNGLDPEVYGF